VSFITSDIYFLALHISLTLTLTTPLEHLVAPSVSSTLGVAKTVR